MKEIIGLGNLSWDTNEIEVCEILLELAASVSEAEPSHNCSEVDWGIKRKRSRTLKYSADHIKVSNTLLQTATSSNRETEKTYFCVDWGIRKKRSVPSPEFFKNKVTGPASSLSSLTKSQESRKRKRDSRDMKDDCDNLEAFNLGFKARKKDSIVSPSGILDQILRFPFWSPNLDMSVAQDLNPYRVVAAEARQRRYEILCKAKQSMIGCKSRVFKICKAKTSIKGYTPRYVVPL